MKMLRTILLGLVFLLMLSACGRNEAIPVCPSLPGETVDGLPSALVQAPTMKIQYQDEEFLCTAALTPSVYTYPLGTAFPAGVRPCEQENLCTVMLADTVGEVRLAVFEEVMNAVESAILFFKSEGVAGERLADTVARVGFDKAEKMILDGSLLERREEILAAPIKERPAEG